MTAREPVSLDQARKAAAQHLMKSGDSHPSTAKSVLLKRLEQCRHVCWDLLAASAGTPDEPQIPMPLLPFARTCVIRREMDAWVAEQRSGNAIRVVVHREPAELAGKLTALEAAR